MIPRITPILLTALLTGLVLPAEASSYGQWGPKTLGISDTAPVGPYAYEYHNNTVSVGYLNAGAFKFQYSENNGLTWLQGVNPAPVSPGISYAIGLNATSWVVANYVQSGSSMVAQFVKSTNNGANWTSLTSIASGQGCGGDIFSGAGMSFAMGVNIMLASIAWRTHDGGTGCNFGSSVQGASYKSLDGGGTWVASSFSPNQCMQLTPGDYLSYGAGTLSTSTDNGTTWTSQSVTGAAGGLCSVLRAGTDAVILINDAATIKAYHKPVNLPWESFTFGASIGAGANSKLLYKDGMLYALARTTGTTPMVGSSSDLGHTWQTESGPLGNNILGEAALVGPGNVVRYVGFESTDNRLHTSLRDTTVYSTAVRDAAGAFARSLVDLECDYGYNATCYVREVGTNAISAQDGRVIRINHDLATLGTKDVCIGDEAAPAALRGLRYTYDSNVVVVCEDSTANPTEAVIHRLTPVLQPIASYSYEQNDVFGPFLMRSRTSEVFAYSTFENAQVQGQIRIDRINPGLHVLEAKMPGITDVAVDASPTTTRYLALNQTAVKAYNETGDLIITLDQTNTPGIGGNSALLRGTTLHIANSTGVYRWTLTDTGATRVAGGQFVYNSTLGEGPCAIGGCLKWSKDQQWVTHWGHDRVHVLNGVGLARVFTTPPGVFEGAFLSAADLDSPNNYLYVATANANDVWKFGVYDATTSTGGDGPIGQLNPPWSPTEDPRRGDPGPDGDDDGLPDGWELENFGNSTNQTSSSDPDGDGYTNAEEYEANTDPTNSTSAPSSHGGDGGGGADINGDRNSRGIWIVAAIALAALAVVLPTTRRNKT